MKMSDVPKKILRFMVGDGNNIHLWLDWHPDGILFERYGYRVDKATWIISKKNCYTRSDTLGSNSY